MSLLRQFTEYVKTEQLFSTEHTLIIAISGGIDSVVLADLCRQAGYKTQLAHCNFHLRGDMSDGDEAFVVNMASASNTPLQIRHFDAAAYSIEHRVSIQVAAREQRYQWFEELLEEAGGVAVARVLTAHHLDDNVETMLMNFFKGTGIAGLRGIQSRRGWLVRPLLFARKEELVNYASDQHLTWRNDQSNQENKYTRNFFRNQLIPMITTVYPEAEQNMAANQQRFADIELLYNEALHKRLKKLVLHNGDELHVPVRKLLQSTALETVTYELFRPYGFTASAVPGIIKLCLSETGKYLSSATHRIIRNRNWLIVAGNEEPDSSIFVIDEPGVIRTNEGSLKITTEPFAGQRLSLGTDTILVDAKLLVFPLVFRKWRVGDYLYPFGMQKKKKVARFLIDQKLSKTAKEKVWVVENQKKITWITGLRMDNRFRVSPATKSVVRLHWTPAGDI